MPIDAGGHQSSIDSSGDGISIAQVMQASFKGTNAYCLPYNAIAAVYCYHIVSLE
jgi:hypothetical protein